MQIFHRNIISFFKKITQHQNVNFKFWHIINIVNQFMSTIFTKYQNHAYPFNLDIRGISKRHIAFHRLHYPWKIYLCDHKYDCSIHYQDNMSCNHLYHLLWVLITMLTHLHLCYCQQDLLSLHNYYDITKSTIKVF